MRKYESFCLAAVTILQARAPDCCESEALEGLRGSNFPENRFAGKASDRIRHRQPLSLHVGSSSLVGFRSKSGRREVINQITGRAGHGGVFPLTVALTGREHPRAVAAAKKTLMRAVIVGSRMRPASPRFLRVVNASS